MTPTYIPISCDRNSTQRFLILQTFAIIACKDVSSLPIRVRYMQQQEDTYG